MAGENQNTGANSTNQSREISSIGKDVLSNEGDINGQLKERLRNLDKVIKAHEKINEKVQLYNDLNKDVKGLEIDILKNLSQQAKLQNQLDELGEKDINRINRKYEDIKAGIKQEEDATKALNKLAREGLFISEKDKNLHKLKLESAQESLDNIIAYNEQLRGSVTTEEAMVVAVQEQLELQRKNNEVLTGQLKLQSAIEARMGSMGKLAKGLAGVIDKLGLGGFLQIDKTIEKMRMAAADGASKWKIFGIAVGDAFKAVGAALTSPTLILGAMAAIMTKLVKSAIEYQDKMFAAGKTLGMNLTQAKGLFNEFQNIASENGKLAMTAKQLVETYSQVNSTLGFMGPKNQEFLTTTTGIQRRIGATAEDMQSLQYFSAATGKSLQSSYASIIGSAKATAARLKIDMTEKQILEGVSKVSATIFNNFKGNVKQIAAAVVTATKLGVTLDQIASAGSSLLDFESSISKEFEAQLLTGRDLDLSKARELALNGKNSELMTELTDKLGSYTQWNEMNVLQQQSYAEALGMSKEMVDEIYKKQELANALGAQAGANLQTQYATLEKQGMSHQKIAGLMGAQAASDALAASASERMEATMERLNDSIGRISQALMPMIEKVAALAERFAAFVGEGNNLRNILIGTASVLTGMLATSVALGFQKKQALITDKLTNVVAEQGLRPNAANAAAKITAGSGFAGPLAIGIGMAAFTALMALSSGGGGGGSVAPSTPMSSPDITPMNPNVANAQATEKAAAGPNKLSTAGLATDKSMNVVLNVDGVQLGKVTTNSLAKNNLVASADLNQYNPGA